MWRTSFPNFRFAALLLKQFEIFLRDLAVIRDAGSRNPKAGQATNMWFDFVYFLGGESFPDWQAVLPAALKQISPVPRSSFSCVATMTLPQTSCGMSCSRDRTRPSNSHLP